MAVVTLGCARNEVDSEELAGRLAGDGYVLVDDADDADAVLVNTCGFIESAKKDSVDAILAATDSGAEVIAVGCMAERYGAELAGALPEATVLGFDDYAQIGDRLDDVLTGRPLVPHTPQDRRLLLPISPVQRTAAVAAETPRPSPGTTGSSASGWPRPVGGAEDRLRLRPAVLVLRHPGLPRRVRVPPGGRGARRGPVAGLPGRHRDRAGERELHVLRQGPGRPAVAGEAAAPAGRGGGRLPGAGRLPAAGRAAAGPARGHRRPRPASRPTSTCPSSTPRRRCCAGCAASAAPTTSCGIIERARALAPGAGFRTNVILGFPGETEDDVAELERFLVEGRLDAVGVFGYSDEEGTEAIGLGGKLDQDEIDARVRRITDLVEELTAQRAEERIGSLVEVLLTEDLAESEGAGTWAGHAAHQDPDADGTTTVTGVPAGAVAGQLLTAAVVDTEGVDLLARVVSASTPPSPYRPGR